MITYRTAKKSDIGQLVNLMNGEYARQKNARYFLWQFFQPAQPSTLIVAIDNKKIIGMFGLQKKTLSNKAIVGELIDLLISPDYRDRGIFKTMADKALSKFKNLQAIVVFPNQAGKRACEKSLGMKTIAKIDSLILDTKNFQDHSDKTNFDKKTINQLIQFKKTYAWRHWRYDLHPDYKYKKIIKDKNNFIIVKIFKDPLTKIKYGDIVDIKQEKITDLSILVARANDYFIKKNIKSITTWALPHTQIFQLFNKLGFKPLFQERFFCIKILNNKNKNLYNLNNWQLVQADAEIY
jgi:N-acetylglutamate synthase-like GNAT family acetyltransferase